jgi:RNAse (barnase) inhibitor barstar
MSANSLAWLLAAGPSGVYRMTGGAGAARLASLARLKRLKAFRVNCAHAHSKRTFLSALARGLGFPRYFGLGWDALADCLTDFAWAPAAGYVILLSGLQGLMQRDYLMALDVLEEAAAFWEDNGVSFYVLLVGAPCRYADLPVVTAG